MSYYDEDFYDEPSEFEEKMLELKESLARSIKEEFQAEMERLKQENTELQKVKQGWESIQREYKSKHYELERERRELEYRVRRERLSSLMSDFEVVMYQADAKRIQGPKCGKCDEHRRVTYITPLGREAKEDCVCATSRLEYKPIECRASKFKIAPNGTELSVWYKKVIVRDYDYYEPSSQFAKVVWHEGLPYGEINKYETFFKTIEECQAYCDFLNAEEASHE